MSNFELHELILCCGPFFFFFSPVPCLFHEWIQTAGKKELRGHAVLFLIAGWQFFFFFFWHLVLLTVCYWRVILSELGNRGSSVLPFSEAAEIREAALAWFSTASTLSSDRCSTSDTPAQCLLISRLHRVECSNVTLKGFFFKEDSELNQKKTTTQPSSLGTVAKLWLITHSRSCRNIPGKEECGQQIGKLSEVLFLVSCR